MKHGLMSRDIKLMSGSPMPFSQLKHLLMSPMGGFSAPSSWQVLPPLTFGRHLPLLSNEINYQQCNTNEQENEPGHAYRFAYLEDKSTNNKGYTYTAQYGAGDQESPTRRARRLWFFGLIQSLLN